MVVCGMWPEAVDTSALVAALTTVTKSAAKGAQSLSAAPRRRMEAKARVALNYLWIRNVASRRGAVNNPKSRHFFWEEDDRCVQRIMTIFMQRPAGARWSDACLSLGNTFDIVKCSGDHVGNRVPDSARDTLDNVPDAVLNLKKGSRKRRLYRVSVIQRQFPRCVGRKRDDESI